MFLVHRLPAWSRNPGQRLVKAPKIHIVDSGLACHLLGADAQRLQAERPLLSRVLESFVVGELRKQLSWSDPHATLFHYRTATGAEVDVIVEWPDGTVAGIEVKASATVGASDFAGLKSLRDRTGAQFRAGAIVYLGDRVVPFGDRLWLVPVSALWDP